MREEETYRLSIGIVSSSLHLKCRVYVGDGRDLSLRIQDMQEVDHGHLEVRCFISNEKLLV